MLLRSVLFQGCASYVSSWHGRCINADSGEMVADDAEKKVENRYMNVSERVCHSNTWLVNSYIQNNRDPEGSSATID